MSLPTIPLPTREEMLAIDLPVELHLTSRGGPVVVRFATEADRDVWVSCVAAWEALAEKTP